MGGMSERPGRYQRSFAGMIGAMLVLLGAVAAFVLFRDAVRDEPVTPVRAVDYERPAEYAAEQAGFDLVAPRALPEGWKATSVRYTPGRMESWHIGFLTDEGRYVGLEQAPELPSTMVRTHVDEDAVQGDDVDIDGEAWQSWTDEDGDTALLLEEGDLVTLVVGTADQGTLVDFVRTLG